MFRESMMPYRSLHEAVEEWMRVIWFAKKFRMELAGDEIGMIGQLDDLCEVAFG